jgi:hypothetical protein
LVVRQGVLSQLAITRLENVQPEGNVGEQDHTREREKPCHEPPIRCVEVDVQSVYS